MPEMNLFLFLSLVMAGILTFHLYRLDANTQAEGTDPPAHRFEHVLMDKPRQHFRPVRAMLTTYSSFPSEFIEVAHAADNRSERAGHIEIDFINSTYPCGDPADDPSQIRCA